MIIYKTFCPDSYVANIRNICQSQVSKLTDPNKALHVFRELLVPVMDKHALIKKLTARSIKDPWVDEELKTLMAERDDTKDVVSRSG